jgi:hypothetical protein
MRQADTIISLAGTSKVVLKRTISEDRVENSCPSQLMLFFSFNIPACDGLSHHMRQYAD